MTPSSLLALLASNAKLATAAAATAAVTAGGGLAVASAVTASNTHAQAGLATVTSDPESTTAGSTNTSAPDPESTSAGTPTTTVTCPSGLNNHGAFVSSIAKTKPAPGSAPGAHGKAVSAAAKSDCGKPAGAGSSSDSQSSDTETPDTEAPDGDTGPPSTHSHGKPSTLPGKAGTHAPSH